MTVAPQYEIIDAENGRFIKAWKRGVPFEDKAVEQLKQSAQLPFVNPYVAAMPDTHWGIGATVGSVIPCIGAVIPAAVGVDIGCGMMAVRTNTDRKHIDGHLAAMRQKIENVVPAGRTNNGATGDRGAFGVVPDDNRLTWDHQFRDEYERLCTKHPGMRARNSVNHLGTLGTGNHFIEVCLDEQDRAWIVIHSGSRGLGNRIGTYFIQLAQKKCESWGYQLPNPDLAYFPQASVEYSEYVQALHFAQRFAWENRKCMMESILGKLSLTWQEEVHCHHNYMVQEKHFGQELLITRKGAVSAHAGDMGIIPGSMGTRSYIVKGLGSEHSFCSCSHGAGRAMGRNEAKRRFTVDDHIKATEGVECYKGEEVLDETPGAYKNIDAVMEAQKDLVEIVHTLKQVVCVKGVS